MEQPGTGADLLEIARSYQPAALLIGLVELDICSFLATTVEGNTAGLTVAELAGRHNLQPRPLAALLEAAAAFGLLAANKGHYTNTPLSARYLDRGSPEYLGNQIASQADQYRGWADLPATVRAGKLVLPNLQTPAGAEADPALRRLLLSLHRGGQSLLPRLTPLLDPYLKRAESLLDIGSGLGTFGVGWAEQYPRLETTLLDRPAVLEMAREMVAASPAHHRVQLLAGNYLSLDFGRENYDLVLFFQVLRTEATANVRRLLQKAALALKPGGHIVIYDTWLADSRTVPIENVLQNLTMSMTYPEGGLFTAPELATWLAEAGLEIVVSKPVAAARPMIIYLAARI